MEHFIITIARGYGSGGSHIGKQLSKILGIPYYDDEILTMASELSGIHHSFFVQANEKISTGQLVFGTWKPNPDWKTLSPDDSKYLSNNNLFAYQAKVMRHLASEEGHSCIIIGKAANYVLNDFNNVLRLNIQAPMEKCIKNITERLVTTEAAAEKSIKTINQYRKSYYRYYTDREWLDPVAYDISINTGRIDEDAATRLILNTLRMKGFL